MKKAIMPLLPVWLLLVPSYAFAQFTAGEQPFAQKLTETQAAGLAERLVTVDVRGNLRGPLVEELRGTKAGGEILAFYKDPEYARAGSNRLNIVFTGQTQNRLGGWRPSSKTMKFNSERVNGWMKKNQVSPERLFEGDPSGNSHLRELAQYLAPAFVHEAVHQRQDARADASGVNYQFFEGIHAAAYQLELEAEALAMDTGFMAEQLQKRGPSYAESMDPFDKKNTEFYIERGVEGVKLSHRRGFYSQLDESEGVAAKEFVEAVSTEKAFGVLEVKNKSAPGTLDTDELARLRELRAAMGGRFKWYALARADSSAAEAKLSGWRQEINGKLYPSKSVGAKAPPELR